MAKYRVEFAQWHSYEVEADTEDEAVEQAEEEFATDMRYPIANVVPDEGILYKISDDEEEEQVDHWYI